jgi:hypothetical protein
MNERDIDALIEANENPPAPNDLLKNAVDNDQEIELQDDWDNTLMDGLEDNLTQETLSATDIEWLQNAANQEKLNNRSHTKIIS